MLRAFCGREGVVGRQCRVHNADVARTQARRDPRFLQLLQKTVIELLIRFGIVLQDVVLHEFFGETVGFRFLLVERLLQELDVVRAVL